MSADSETRPQSVAAQFMTYRVIPALQAELADARRQYESYLDRPGDSRAYWRGHADALTLVIEFLRHLYD